MRAIDRLRLPSVQDPSLLPCPFCGSPAEIEFWHGGKPSKRHVSCSSLDCEVSPGITGETKRKAIKKWNTRA